jgi:hypothetical protein
MRLNKNDKVASVTYILKETEREKQKEGEKLSHPAQKPQTQKSLKEKHSRKQEKSSFKPATSKASDKIPKVKIKTYKIIE